MRTLVNHFPRFFVFVFLFFDFPWPVQQDMAAQLGIQKRPAHYWYCMFALRYPLAPEWEAVVREDTRWYLNLQQDTAQPVHPMVKKFREHLSDVIANEFLGDELVRLCAFCSILGGFRGFSQAAPPNSK